jgi:hypothetical protein
MPVYSLFDLFLPRFFFGLRFSGKLGLFLHLGFSCEPLLFFFVSRLRLVYLHEQRLRFSALLQIQGFPRNINSLAEPVSGKLLPGFPDIFGYSFRSLLGLGFLLCFFFCEPRFFFRFSFRLKLGLLPGFFFCL